MKPQTSIRLLPLLLLFAFILAGCRDSYEASDRPTRTYTHMKLYLPEQTFEECPSTITLYLPCKEEGDLCDFRLDTYVSVENYTDPAGGFLYASTPTPFPPYTDCLMMKPEKCSPTSEIGQLVSSDSYVSVTLHLQLTQPEHTVHDFALRFYQPSTHTYYVCQPYRLSISHSEENALWNAKIYCWE